MYTGGSNYNPAQMLRDDTVKSATGELDTKLARVANKEYAEFAISDMVQMIGLIKPDTKAAEQVWDSQAIAESVKQFAKINKQSTGYVYVDRNRDLDANRRETAGILSGGEVNAVPQGKLTIYLLRTTGGRNKNPAWWPQVRFPSGRYAFAFAI